MRCRHPLRSMAFVAALAALAGCAGSVGPQDGRLPSRPDHKFARYCPPRAETKGWAIHAVPHPNPSAAYTLMNVILEASARRVDRVGAKPTIISREMMIATTGMYDAWACYDDKAVGTRLHARLRRPTIERTKGNREKAMACAVMRCLEDVFPEDLGWIRERAKALGVDLANRSTDASTPEGVGNTVAAAIIDYRHRDGANQLGDEIGSDGEPYSDYTMYKPTRGPEEEQDPARWKPIPFADGKGGKIRPGFLTPHWYRVKSVALERNDQFRGEGPPKPDSEQFRREVDECIEANAALTLEEKAVVEFMRDGPRSTGQSGHWLLFAQDLSRRERYGLDQDVKLFFCIANVAFDAFIACWETKRVFDSSRPYWYVRWNRKGQMVRGYAGPGEGFRTMDADQWHPYSPDTFVTPPFPGYTSGHATVSGASGKILELFSGSDRFEFVAKKIAGELTEPNVPTSQMQAVEGVPARDVAATAHIDLALPTFSATSEMAAESRLLGGYHIRADNNDGLRLGRKLAEFVYPRYRAYTEGTAPERK